MTAPAVSSTTDYASPASNATSWQIFTGLSVNKGSILAVSARIESGGGGSNLSTASSGWQQLGTTVQDNGGGFQTSSAVFYKTQNGSGEFTLASTVSMQFTAMLVAIDSAEEIEATVTADSANPPSHTISASGARDVLWIAVASSGTGAASGGPLGYSGFDKADPAGEDGPFTAVAYRSTRAMTENPATFTGVSGETAAWTIALYVDRRRKARGGAII